MWLYYRNALDEVTKENEQLPLDDLERLAPGSTQKLTNSITETERKAREAYVRQVKLMEKVYNDLHS